MHLPLLRTSLLSLLAAGLCATAALTASPAAAQAADVPPRFATAPVVEALEVNATAGLAPGSTVDFALRGTPRGNARVQLMGPDIVVPLREDAPGVYTGRYTVRADDRLDADAVIRSTLTVGSRTVVSNYTYPPSFRAQQQAAHTAPIAPLKPLDAQHVLRIDRFAAVPVDRLEPGTELRFTLDGPPGARATFELPNVASNVPMVEERPGHYEGRYTLRRQDVLGAGPVVGTLRAGPQWVSVPLEGPLLASGATGTRMGAAPMTATAPLALQIVSPGPGTAVDANGMVVEGRTAPGAMVRVQVDLVPPHAPGTSVVAVPAAEQVVMADANGHFAFSLGPQRVQPGTRYDVVLSAMQGEQRTPEQRLVLYQRP